jgi:glycosyltransferase involved in cell wall biosynthesis
MRMLYSARPHSDIKNMEQTHKKPLILLFIDYYLPSMGAGGPVISIANMIKALAPHYRFLIITRNHDLTDKTPFALPNNKLISHPDYDIIYLTPNNQNLSYYRQSIQQYRPQFIYLNSFFSTRFSLLPLLAAQSNATKIPVILAPRGEFSPGALAIKKTKKKVYLLIVALFRLYRAVTFHVTAAMEKKNLQKYYPHAKIALAPNLCFYEKIPPLVCEKKTGQLNIIFLSRITKKKNLAGALTLLKTLKGNITFTLYGTIEDPAYWAQCQKIADKLPENIAVKYAGALSHDKILVTFSQYDVFLFPSFGENFGHVILEALTVGCPVITSDKTPWHDLKSAGAGFCLPLSDTHAYINALQQLVYYNQEQMLDQRKKARHYAIRHHDNTTAIARYQALFGEKIT